MLFARRAKEFSQSGGLLTSIKVMKNYGRQVSLPAGRQVDLRSLKKQISLVVRRSINQMRSNDFPSRAQSMLEYLILIGVVTVVLVALGPLFKRGIQAVVRLTADQLQTQANAEQKPTKASGYLIDQYSSSNADNSKEK